MSMEFLTWDWMHLFFKEDTEKFLYKHLADSLCTLPWLAILDHFQHWVYENPNATPKERKKQSALVILLFNNLLFFLIWLHYYDHFYLTETSFNL